MKSKKHSQNPEEMSGKMENIDKNSENNQQAFENSIPEAKDAEKNNAEAFEDKDVIMKLQQEVEEQKNKYLRLMAEFDNYKRRSAQEKTDFIKTAGKDVLVPMLEILDDMDRAETQIDQDTNIDHIKEGVNLVFNKFRNLLITKGVKQIETLGTEFDTEKHEAVANVPAPSPDKAGKIIDELQKGYTLNDKIIRYPKVVVAN